MMTLSEYIKIILKKKNWTNIKLAEELSKLGTKVYPQNITNYLNNNYIRPKFAKKLEVALGLKEDDLLKFVGKPISKQGKLKLREIKEKLDDK